MIRRTLIAALLLAIAAPLFADFNGIERALTRRLGSPTYIPLFGLVRLATWVGHPEGVHDLQLAVYEDKPGRIDATEIEGLVAREVPRGFMPIVRTRSRDGDWTFIYAKPGKGDRVELFLVSHDPSDTVLMRLDVDAARVARNIGDAHAIRKMAQR